jgi:hypothetical protein
MMIALHRKTLEPALIQVALTDRFAVLAPPPDVSGTDPLHELGEVIGVPGPENEVPVIAHQAVAQNPHPGAPAALFQQLEKREKIAGLLEDVQPAVAAVEHVKHDSAGG